MTPAADAHERGLILQEELQGTPTFRYFGIYYRCLPSTLSKGMTLGLGAPESEIQLTLIVRRSQFAARSTDQFTQWTADSDTPTVDSAVILPARNKHVWYRETECRIASVDDDPSGVAWRLHLSNPHS